LPEVIEILLIQNKPQRTQRKKAEGENAHFNLHFVIVLFGIYHYTKTLDVLQKRSMTGLHNPDVSGEWSSGLIDKHVKLD